jgi:hypothetical protein
LELKARVSICIPSQGFFVDQMGAAYADLRETCAVNGIGVQHHGFRSSMITASRNKLARMGLETDPTHILWIDTDNTFPRDGLCRLLEHDKDVAGAFYSKKAPPYDTCGAMWPGTKTEDVAKGGLHRASVMPHGFVLIKASVYGRIRFPWYYETVEEEVARPDYPEGIVSEDVNFSRACTKAGIQMWCDSGLSFQMGHCGLVNVPCLPPGTKQPQTVLDFVVTHKDAA